MLYKFQMSLCINIDLTSKAKSAKRRLNLLKKQHINMGIWMNHFQLKKAAFSTEYRAAKPSRQVSLIDKISNR